LELTTINQNKNMRVDQKSPWVAMLFTALAGGLGWGIRGQYGHETGAMLAGLLVALVLVYLFGYQLSSLSAARAVALATVAIGFGGSMTYGQTLGLTQDAPLIGNMSALRWGLLGTFIKGSIWIGFFGLFLGIGLGEKKYSLIEMALMLTVSIFLLYLGTLLLNEPFDPANKKLPLIYFSDHWYWEPGETLQPRRELWGGLLFALAWLIVYAGFVKKDTLARNMSFWGYLLAD
jgi:glucan phosphoethanolaminetransferase (alkaline phosphatase superfamily)